MKEKISNYSYLIDLVLQAIIVVLNILVLVNGIKERNQPEEND
jgi:hypothetical protein